MEKPFIRREPKAEDTLMQPFVKVYIIYNKLAVTTTN